MKKTPGGATGEVEPVHTLVAVYLLSLSLSMSMSTPCDNAEAVKMTENAVGEDDPTGYYPRRFAGYIKKRPGILPPSCAKKISPDSGTS